MNIKQDEYEAWCSNPMTMMFREFLKGRSQEVETHKNKQNPIGQDSQYYHTQAVATVARVETYDFVAELLSGNEEDFIELNDEEEVNE